MPRKMYQLSDEQFHRIALAEDARVAWREIGDELGFYWETTRPVSGSRGQFMAEPKPKTNELAPLYRLRGNFTAFIWTEATGEGGPVERYWTPASYGGDPAGYLGVNPGGCGNVQRVWDGCVVVTNEQKQSWAMSREDFEQEYQPLDEVSRADV